MLIALYPNATHIIQPLDVAFFKALKVVWCKTYEVFCKESGSIYLQKHQFSLALKNALENLDVSKISKNGFRRCGLHPFDADAPDYTKIFKKASRSAQIDEKEVEVEDDHPDHRVLNLLEKFIAPETLQKFKINRERNWSGELQDLSLFNVWMKINYSSKGKSVPADLVSFDYLIIN